MSLVRAFLVRTTCCLAAALFTAPGIFGQDEELTPEEQNHFANTIQSLLGAQHGTFIVAGRVVDENGQPLQGVSMEIEKAKLKNMWTKTEYETETVIINGSFSLNISGYAGLCLTFSKSGHYQQQFQFSLSVPGSVSKNAAEGQPINPLLLKREDLVVVLERAGTFTELIRYHETLEYSTEGRGTVIDFDRPHYTRRSLRTVGNVHDPAQLPTNCVYVIAARDADGKIAVVEKPRPGTTLVDTVPQRLTLSINGSDAGFVKFMPDPSKKISRQRKSAPQSGYVREIIIEADDFVEGGSRGGALFFVRTKGKFGKGGTGWVEVGADRRVVQISVGFNLQPDGSKNLERDPGLSQNIVHINNATEASDTTPPVLTVLGDNPATVECANSYTDAGATASDDSGVDLTASIVVANNVNAGTPGSYGVNYSVSDPSGNSNTVTRTVRVVDHTRPQIVCPAPITVGCDLRLAVPISFTTTATDTCDPNPSVSCVPATGFGTKVGTTNVLCTATDASGNSAQCNFTVTRTPIGFTGFLPPIGGADATGGRAGDPVQTFKRGKVIPVKFALDCQGNPIVTGIHTLQTIKWSNETSSDPPIDATPADAATTGNQFRFTDQQWHYNLDTKAMQMSVGTWELRATLSDGSTHSAWIALR